MRPETGGRSRFGRLGNHEHRAEHPLIDYFFLCVVDSVLLSTLVPEFFN